MRAGGRPGIRSRGPAIRVVGLLLAGSGAVPAALSAQTPASPLERPADSLAAPSRSGALSLEIGFVADVLGATAGGRSREARYLDNLGLLLRLDAETALGLRNTALVAHVQSNRGGSLSAAVGDFQGASNIEAPESWRLYELWIEHTPVPERLSLLAGVYDLNAELDVIPVAADFLNSSFGFGPEYATAGVAGPSTFPLTTLGLRISLRPVPFGYVTLSVSDGAPGTPTDPDRSRFALRADEGVLLSWEAGYGRAPGTGGHGVISRARMSADVATKLAVGGWRFTRRFDRFDGTGTGSSWGLYSLGQRRIFGSGSRRATVFGRLGLASAAVNRVEFYVGGGVAIGGPFPGRADDVLGAGIAVAGNGTHFLEWRDRTNVPTDRTETVFEAFYAFRVSERLRIQPDIQWIVNPGMDPSLDDALVIGGRGVLTFSFP